MFRGVSSQTLLNSVLTIPFFNRDLAPRYSTLNRFTDSVEWKPLPSTPA